MSSAITRWITHQSANIIATTSNLRQVNCPALSASPQVPKAYGQQLRLELRYLGEFDSASSMTDINCLWFAWHSVTLLPTVAAE
jgi:hypothetical protein